MSWAPWEKAWLPPGMWQPWQGTGSASRAAQAACSRPVACISCTETSGGLGTANWWQEVHSAAVPKPGASTTSWTAASAVEDRCSTSTAPSRRWQTAQVMPSAALGSGTGGVWGGAMGSHGRARHAALASISSAWAAVGAWQCTQKRRGSAR